MTRRILLILIVATSCSRSNDLSEYYNHNKVLHAELTADAKKTYQDFNTPIVLKKNAATNSIWLLFLNKDSSTYIPIYFDDKGNEIRTGKNIGPSTSVSSALIVNFSKSIYHAVQVDSLGIFLAKEYTSQFSEYEIGIFTPFEKSNFNRDNIINKLPDNFYVYKAIVP